MLTREELEAFAGLDKSYVEMDRKISESAPIVQFIKMDFEVETKSDGMVIDEVWVCKHGGHTKAT